MISFEQARHRLQESELPVALMEVAQVLRDAGHQAVVVGGGVRDRILGLPVDDWDLASSARPDEVVALFRKTIPTGLQHGTVTVLAGRGESRLPVEVTTFRGEGAYKDGRRPSEVHFLRDLEEDLARRDFTVNAMAWDPIAKELSDPFDGLGDLRERRIRAVGRAADRFQEDGLRIMRALRFAARLGFELDPETQQALAPSLGVLSQVSRERVRDELLKLLRADHAAKLLPLMWSSGVWALALGGAPRDQAIVERASEAVAELEPSPLLRLAALVHAEEGEGDARTFDARVASLKLSRSEGRELRALIDPRVRVFVGTLEARERRKLYADLEPARLAQLLSLGGFLARIGHPVVPSERLRAECEGSPRSKKELAIGGGELAKRAGLAKGPSLGRILAELFEWVLESPERNTAEQLVARAQDLQAR